MRHRRGYLRGGTATEFDRLVGVQDLHRQRALVGRRLAADRPASSSAIPRATGWVVSQHGNRR